MKYAVIKTGGKQYRVSEGNTLEVERLTHDGKNINFPQVLLYVEDSKINLGKPYIPGAMVKATLVGDVKGDKIRVSKFKSKVRYRKVTGHRQSLTKVTIDSIQLSAPKSK